MTTFPRGVPEAQGVSSRAILALVEAFDREVTAVHSLMLVRHGIVIAEGWWKPYRATDPHVLFSLSKSFTSTAIGLLVHEGRLSIDDPILKFFPKDAPPNPSPALQAMKVRHLLAMSTGHTTEPAIPNGNAVTWVQAFLRAPVDHMPGTHFLYNSIATYMLSAVVQTVTGECLTDYLQPRLFTPLGIKSPFWEKSPQRIDTGGWGLMLTTEQIAAFGQLYLQKGVWNGKQVIPEAWIDIATSIHTDNSTNESIDWQQGYGFQFWRCRHNAYRGDGAFGQYCIIMPDQDAVLVITGGLDNMQHPLNLVWEHLLPAFQPDSLPADSQAHAALTDKLANLQIPPITGASTNTTTARVSGRSYTLENNLDEISAICFNFGEKETTVTLTMPRGDQTLRVGHGTWITNSARWMPLDESMRTDPRYFAQVWQVAASGAWTDDHTFVIKTWWTETPFERTITCKFSGDGVTIDQKGNVGFGPLRAPTIRGK